MKTLLLASVLAVTMATAHATVNVNTAQQSELLRVKGLDKVKAKAIIEYRHKNGFYDSLADLQKVPGFGPDVVARIAPEVAFRGEAYVPSKVAVKEKDAKVAAKDKDKEKPKA